MKNLDRKITIIEVAFENQEFEIPSDSNVIKIRGKTPAYQRERLVNIALEKTKTETLAWLDCDIIFMNKNWYNQAANLLDNYNIIQVFEEAVFLDQFGQQEKIFKSFCYQKLFDSNEGHTGFGWACRRDVLPNGLLYDGSLCNGDKLMAFASVNLSPTGLNEYQLKHYQYWAKEFYEKTQGKINYVSGQIHHLYHGSWKQRKYKEFTDMIAKLHNPYDIKIENGLYEPEGELKQICRKFLNSKDPKINFV